MSVSDTSAHGVVELTTWRQAHEIHSLRDMLAIYRQWATAIAAENSRLHAEIDGLKATASRTHAGRSPRTRSDCPA
jgi:hypothetical protein